MVFDHLDWVTDLSPEPPKFSKLKKSVVLNSPGIFGDSGVPSKKIVYRGEEKLRPQAGWKSSDDDQPLTPKVNRLKRKRPLNPFNVNSFDDISVTPDCVRVNSFLHNGDTSSSQGSRLSDVPTISSTVADISPIGTPLFHSSAIPKPQVSFDSFDDQEDAADGSNLFRQTINEGHATDEDGWEDDDFDEIAQGLPSRRLEVSTAVSNITDITDDDDDEWDDDGLDDILASIPIKQSQQNKKLKKPQPTLKRAKITPPNPKTTTNKIPKQNPNPPKTKTTLEEPEDDFDDTLDEELLAALDK